jgi:hypothetical protein
MTIGFNYFMHAAAMITFLASDIYGRLSRSETINSLAVSLIRVKIFGINRIVFQPFVHSRPVPFLYIAKKTSR